MGQMIHRTEVHTLMMKMGDIMTISVRKEVSLDVFRDADWPLFDLSCVSSCTHPIPNISVVEFIVAKTASYQSFDALAASASSKALAYVNLLPNNRLRTWFFLADGAWQPATRIVKYKKLWKNHPEFMKTRGILCVGDEVEFTSKEGVRYAGLLEISGEAYVEAIRLSRTNHACAIICSNRLNIEAVPSIQSIFYSAFPEKDGSRVSNVNWSWLSAELCYLNDILIRVCGMYDDREVSIQVIMPTGLVT
jgi:hypothetical protein